MAEAALKLPVKSESKGDVSERARYSFENVRREFDRMLEDFNYNFWRPRHVGSLFDYAPFGRLAEANSLAVDVADNDGEYEITAELPGIDEKDIDVSVRGNGLVIKAEKKEQKEEHKKGYVVSERRYGAFERQFGLPPGVDVDKISATFRKGVLTISLPKTVEAQKHEKKITVKAN